MGECAKQVCLLCLPARCNYCEFWDIQWRSAEIWTAVGWNMAAYLTFAILVFLSLHSLKHLSGAVKSAMFMVSMVGNTVYIGFHTYSRVRQYQSSVCHCCRNRALGFGAGLVHLGGRFLGGKIQKTFFVRRRFN